MTDLHKAAEMALDALLHMCNTTKAQNDYNAKIVDKALITLKNALAQYEQAAIKQGWDVDTLLAQSKQTMTPISQDQYERLCFTCGACTGKPWVGLTDSDIALVLINSGSTTENFVNGIESKLKELNR